MIKKIFLLFLVVFFLVSLAPPVLAQQSPREVEVDYPEVAGEEPTDITTPVPEYVKYIYNFLIWASALLALIVLIYAGFKYFTSAGNVERIREAKNQIAAALLGLLILFGSYLILISINPELVVFHLKRLRPIISELTPGVLACKEEVEVDRAWQLANNFKYAEEYWQQIEIKEELDEILDEIALKCYSVAGKGNIASGFNDEITDIYFISGEQIINKTRHIAMYGVILYENTNYEGKSQPLYNHLKPGNLGGVVTPIHIPKQKLIVNPSSIKPFLLIPEHHSEKAQVWLFQDYNRNNENENIKAQYYKLNPGNWYWEFDVLSGFCSLPEAICEAGYASPRSMQVGGDFLAILVTPDGRSDVFYNQIDNNLDDNLNIINWVRCKDYESKHTTWKCIINCCAQPAVKDLIIISAKMY